MNLSVSYLGFHVGRMTLVSLFVLGGVNKIISYEETALRMESEGLPLVGIALPMTIALELFGGLAVALNVRKAWIAACALAVFTLVVNVVFHPFWEFSDQMREVKLSLFFKNLSIAGALLMFASFHSVMQSHQKGLKK